MGAAFDLLIIILALCFLWVGLKKGFLKSVIELLIMIISVLISYSVSPILAKKYYDSFIYNDLTNRINDILLQDEVLNNTAQKMLSLVNNVSVFTIDDVLKILNGHGNKSVEIEAMLQPIIINIVALCAFVLISTITCLLLKLIFKFIFKLPKLPFLGLLDSILGLGVGALKFAIFMFIFVAALKTVLTFNTQNNAINQGIEESKIFNQVYNINLNILEIYLKTH